MAAARDGAVGGLTPPTVRRLLTWDGGALGAGDRRVEECASEDVMTVSKRCRQQQQPSGPVVPATFRRPGRYAASVLSGVPQLASGSPAASCDSGPAAGGGASVTSLRRLCGTSPFTWTDGRPQRGLSRALQSSRSVCPPPPQRLLGARVLVTAPQQGARDGVWVLLRWDSSNLEQKEP